MIVTLNFSIPTVRTQLRSTVPNNQKGKNDSPLVNLMGTAYISSANCYLASFATGHS
jgi:hypothetical protein